MTSAIADIYTVATAVHDYSCICICWREASRDDLRYAARLVFLAIFLRDSRCKYPRDEALVGKRGFIRGLKVDNVAVSTKRYR